MKAIWNEQVLAESTDTVVVEGNHYFPAKALDQSFFKKSAQTSFCPWKGTASYYDIVVDDQTNEGAAWYYPSASDKAKHIEGRVAFWRGVAVVD